MIVKIDQRTEEWHKFRLEGIGGSDISVLLGVNPWKNKDQLIREKLGHAPIWKQNPAMLRGELLEPVARALYQKRFMVKTEPACIIHDDIPILRASFDGHNPTAKIDLEIKVPNKYDHQAAIQGKVPDKYIPQVQHLLLVSGSKSLHYYSFTGRNQKMIEVYPDRAIQGLIINKAKEFWEELEHYKKHGLPEAPSIRRSVKVVSR